MKDLTQRQVEILKGISEGFSPKEIGLRLGITAKTVEFHKSRIEQRLHVKGTALLVRAAIRLGHVVA